jgi:hypothetical protein
MPVAAFGSVLEDGWLAFFFCAMGFILAPADLRRVGSSGVIAGPRGLPLLKRAARALHH